MQKLPIDVSLINVLVVEDKLISDKKSIKDFFESVNLYSCSSIYFYTDKDIFIFENDGEYSTLAWRKFPRNPEYINDNDQIYFEVK